MCKLKGLPANMKTVSLYSRTERRIVLHRVLAF